MEQKSIIASFTEADHRARLQNIRTCRVGMKGYAWKHLINQYVPGQAVYQLSGADYEPNDEDERRLKELAESGIGLVQVWSTWWNNPWGGKPMYQMNNPGGFRRLIDMVHSVGMKILPYTATNFYERTDPNFQSRWAFDGQFDLIEPELGQTYDLAHCSPGSPAWRTHVMGPMMRIMDEYDVDGLYNDAGYLRRADATRSERFYAREPRLVEDEVIAFEESQQSDGAMADMLALIYSEVKRRGGIYKLHKEGVDRVMTDLKVYDYLWVGEAVHDISFTRERTSSYSPYLIPEFSRGYDMKNQDELYLYAIPYLQFPVSRSAETGGKLEDHTLHRAWLRRYQPLVEEGTWAWIDIDDCPLVQRQSGGDQVVSVFANRRLSIVLANFETTPRDFTLGIDCRLIDDSASPPTRKIRLEGRSLAIVVATEE